MSHAVVDASIVIEALSGASRARAARDLLSEYRWWTVPSHFDLDCINVWRRMVALGQMSQAYALRILAGVAEGPIERRSTHEFNERILQLGANLTPYDAAYVTLAELLEVPLLTADIRLARAPGPRCEFIVC